MTWLPAIMTIVFFSCVFGIGVTEIMRKSSRILPNILALFISISIYAVCLVVFNDDSAAFKAIWASGMMANFFAAVTLA